MLVEGRQPTLFSGTKRTLRENAVNNDGGGRAVAYISLHKDLFIITAACKAGDAQLVTEFHPLS